MDSDDKELKTTKDNKEKPLEKKLEDINLSREPGTSQPPNLQRLPSLRPPRDLTLSAYRNITNPNPIKKKIYIPNFNVQRNKPSETVVSKPKPEPPKPNLPNPAEKKDNVRGRGKKNLVQLDQGVFAQGVPGQRTAGRGQSSSGGSSNDGVLKKPVVNFSKPPKVDKEEEEKTMNLLLQDDFIDDPSLEPNFNNCPVVLPHTKVIEGFKKKGTESKADVKKVQYKTVKEVFDSAKVSDPGFIYFKMPNSIPGLKTRDESKDNEDKDEPKASTSAEQPSDKPNIEHCPLSSFAEGQIGKLQILKSGRARLVLGDVKMWVDMGIPSDCKQDAVSIELEKKTLTGHTYNLGPVNTRMIVTPDLDTLLPAVKPTLTFCSQPFIKLE